MGALDRFAAASINILPAGRMTRRGGAPCFGRHEAVRSPRTGGNALPVALKYVKDALRSL